MTVGLKVPLKIASEFMDELEQQGIGHFIWNAGEFLRGTTKVVEVELDDESQLPQASEILAKMKEK